MVRTDQGGSVVSFIVVAALLVLGTAGLLYWVKQGDTPRSTAPDVAVSGTEDKDSREVEEGANTQGTNGNRSSDNRGADQDQTTTTDTSKDNSDTSSQPVTHLSQTGPADTVLQAVMIGVLTTASAAYIQSRKQATARRSSL